MKRKEASLGYKVAIFMFSNFFVLFVSIVIVHSLINNSILGVELV